MAHIFRQSLLEGFNGVVVGEVGDYPPKKGNRISCLCNCPKITYLLSSDRSPSGHSNYDGSKGKEISDVIREQLNLRREEVGV